MPPPTDDPLDRAAREWLADAHPSDALRARVLAARPLSSRRLALLASGVAVLGAVALLVALFAGPRVSLAEVQKAMHEVRTARWVVRSLTIAPDGQRRERVFEAWFRREPLALLHRRVDEGPDHPGQYLSLLETRRGRLERILPKRQGPEADKEWIFWREPWGNDDIFRDYLASQVELLARERRATIWPLGKETVTSVIRDGRRLMYLRNETIGETASRERMRMVTEGWIDPATRRFVRFAQWHFDKNGKLQGGRIHEDYEYDLPIPSGLLDRPIPKDAWIRG